MAQNVTYADLRFVKAPLGNSTPPRSLEAAPAAEDDAELTYENIHLAQTLEVKSWQGTEQSKVPWWSAWYLPLSLLGACLFLLATTIGLGVRYWQVSQQLQQASKAHVEESSHLSQQLSTKEESLGQRASELEDTRSQLKQSKQELEQLLLERNNTQELLQQRDDELARQQAELVRVKEEMQETKEKLSQTETALSNIRPCEQPACCPEDWLLYRGMCLFFSNQKKSWDESKKECEQKSAQLLITKSWNYWTIPNLLRGTEVQYWIGLTKYEHVWKWIDGSPFSEYWFLKSDYYSNQKNCGVMKNGSETNEKCSNKNAWICEKAPQPAQPDVGPL